MGARDCLGFTFGQINTYDAHTIELIPESMLCRLRIIVTFLFEVYWMHIVIFLPLFGTCPILLAVNSKKHPTTMRRRELATPTPTIPPKTVVSASTTARTVLY